MGSKYPIWRDLEQEYGIQRAPILIKNRFFAEGNYIYAMHSGLITEHKGKQNTSKTLE